MTEEDKKGNRQIFRMLKGTDKRMKKTLRR